MSGTYVALEKSGTGWEGREAVGQASKSFMNKEEVPLSDGLASAEGEEGGVSDGGITQDQHRLQQNGDLA